MSITPLTYKQIARRYYINEDCRTENEFVEDLNRVNHIIRSLRRYDEKSFNPRVLINQMITFFNVFDVRGVELIISKIGTDSQTVARLHSTLDAMGIVTDPSVEKCGLYHSIKGELNGH